MKILKQLILFAALVLSIFVFSSGILIAQNQIPISIISNGGGNQSNANYFINGTLGQVSINSAASTNYKVQSGFWYIYYEDVVVIVEDNEIIPIVYKLEQNYPNPFNPSTIIKFAVPERIPVLIKIYDILGAEVLTLVNEELDVGWYERTFNASQMATGIYIYRMCAGNYVNTKKMVMIK